MLVIITDVSDWADATTLIYADESTVVRHTFYHQQLLQDHIASYDTSKQI